MKNIKILLVTAIIAAFSLTSCNKDDNNSTPSTSLVGKWNYSKEGTVVNGQEVLIDYTDNETGCSKDYVQFTATNTFSDIDYDSSEAPCEMFTTTGTYSKSGSTVTLTSGGFTVSGTILNLTATELKVKDTQGNITVYTKA